MTGSKILDFIEKKQRHIHNIHEKKLKEVHQAFEKAFPLSKKTKKQKNSNKKKFRN